MNAPKEPTRPALSPGLQWFMDHERRLRVVDESRRDVHFQAGTGWQFPAHCRRTGEKVNLYDIPASCPLPVTEDGSIAP